MMPSDDILFYDGPCSLCNYTVKKLIQFEKQGVELKFASLDSALAKSILDPKHLEKPYKGLVLLQNNQFHVGAKAVRKLSCYLKFPFSFLAKITPGFFYSFIASNRQIFGTSNIGSCEIPKGENHRFLS